MNKKVVTSSLALAFLLLNLVSTSGSNPPRPAPPADVLSFLPASDAVAVIDVHRLMNEALPRIFSGDPAKLAASQCRDRKIQDSHGHRSAHVRPRGVGPALHLSFRDGHEDRDGGHRARNVRRPGAGRGRTHRGQRQVSRSESSRRHDRGFQYRRSDQVPRVMEHESERAGRLRAGSKHFGHRHFAECARGDRGGQERPREQRPGGAGDPGSERP